VKRAKRLVPSTNMRVKMNTHMFILAAKSLCKKSLQFLKKNIYEASISSLFMNTKTETHGKWTNLSKQNDSVGLDTCMYRLMVCSILSDQVGRYTAVGRNLPLHF
jgi:hypothetical protein